MNMKRILPLLLIAALLLAACGGTPSSQPGSTGAYTAGTYTGEGQGYGGTVTVTIETDGNSITKVTAAGEDETPNVGGAALEDLAAQVLAAQSAEIDGVAGATVNFMTQKMIVEFAEGADAKQVMQAVLKACRKVEPDCEIELG